MKEKLEKVFDILFKLTNEKNLLYIKNAIVYTSNYAIIKSDLLITIDTKLLEMIVNNLCLYYFSEHDIEIEYFYLYNYDIVLIETGKNMKKVNNIEIPIDNRKIFVLYSHKDKELVLPFIEKLKNLGISLRIDSVEIDFGENIIEKIQEAIKKCETSFLFLRENTKNALYQKHELITIFNDSIKNLKKIIPIKLDNVDLNDILYGLNNYLHVDYLNEEDINKLISKLMNNCIKKENT